MKTFIVRGRQLAGENGEPVEVVIRGLKASDLQQAEWELDHSFPYLTALEIEEVAG